MKGRPGLALAAALLTFGPLTAGCGSGINAETLSEGSTIDGANAQTGDLRIRNGFLAAPQSLAFPAGTDVPIHVTVANIGDRADTLTEVTSPLGDVLIQRSQPPSGPPSEEPSVPAGPPTTAPEPQSPVSIGAGQAVTFGGAGTQLILSQTSKAIRTASFVPITFRFAQSDEVTIQAPVGSGYGPGAGPTSSQAPSSGESESSEPSAEPSPAGS